MVAGMLTGQNSRFRWGAWNRRFPFERLIHITRFGAKGVQGQNSPAAHMVGRGLAAGVAFRATFAGGPHSGITHPQSQESPGHHAEGSTTASLNGEC